MKILFIHQNFPAQFKHLAPSLVKAGHDVAALCMRDLRAATWGGVKIHRYEVSRGNSKDTHPWLIDYESKIIRGEACMRAAMSLKDQGYVPDIVISHPGWGESLFIKEVWPSTCLKIYCEFFYSSTGFDVGFDPEFTSKNLMDGARITLKNANTLLHFESASAALCPTEWQASTFPAYCRNKMSVIHDGIDTDHIRPSRSAHMKLPNGDVITQEDEVVTYVNRNLEPYRGIHIFIRSLPEILKKKPNCQVLVVGQESNSGYGVVAKDNRSWKETYMAEISGQMTKQDLSRVHFLGLVEYEILLKIYQISSVHVYLTYPFVLSWSLLEAMSSGCCVVASNTGPVNETISDDINGRLIDFFDHNDLSLQVVSLLDDDALRSEFSMRARESIVDRYDLHSMCLPRLEKWCVS